MFVAIYRWRIKPGQEAAFEQGWERTSIEVRSMHGSLGSRLHRSDDGTYMSYARWNSVEERERYRAHFRTDPIGFRLMRDAVEEELPAMEFTIVGNLLEEGVMPQGILSEVIAAA